MGVTLHDPGLGKEDALKLLHPELDSTTDRLGISCTGIISGNIFLGVGEQPVQVYC